MVCLHGMSQTAVRTDVSVYPWGFGLFSGLSTQLCSDLLQLIVMELLQQQ